MKHNKTNDEDKTKPKTFGNKLIMGLIFVIIIIFGLIIYNMYSNDDTSKINTNNLGNSVHTSVHKFLTNLTDDNIIKDQSLIQKINSSITINQSLSHDKFTIGDYIYIRFLKEPFS